MALTLPSRMAPVPWHRTEFRCANVTWTDAGQALVSEYDRATRRTRLSVVSGEAGVKVLSDRSAEDAYANPGTPYTPAGRDTVLTHDGRIYLLGLGASPDGDRPFADRLDLAHRARPRACSGAAVSSSNRSWPWSPGDGSRLLTRHESKTSPPNYVLRATPGPEPGNRVNRGYRGPGRARRPHVVRRSGAADAGRDEGAPHLHAQGRRGAVRHALPAAGLHGRARDCRS